MDSLTLKGQESTTIFHKHESQKLHHAFPMAPDRSLLTFSAALVASNVINGNVDGVAIDPVTFTGDSDATMALIAQAINNMSTVKSATVVEVAATTSDDRVIEVEHATPGSFNALTGFVVTAGASQATIAVTIQLSSVKAGMPVELNSTSGAVQPLTAATASTTMIGVAIYPDTQKGVCTVMLLGMAIVESIASGAVTPGPVKYDGWDAATNKPKYSSATVTATNLAGWACTSVADTEEVRVITKY